MMRRTMLALGAACVMSSHANADSSVTLYGIIDIPIEFATHQASSAATVNPTTGVVTAQPGGNRYSMLAGGGLQGNRWGLRVVEDLGAGLKAVAVLEGGFGATNGTLQQGGRLFGRQAYVGLNSTTYGQVTFGRQYTTIYDALVNYDPFFTGSTYSPLIAMLGLATRDDNMAKYTGTFGPITLEGHWSFGAGTSPLMVTPLANGGAGQVPGHFRDNTAYGAALTFARGPFSASVTLDQWNPAITTGNAGSAKKLAGAASYKFGQATLMGGYRWGNTKDSFDTVLLRDDFYWAGITYQVTPAFFLSGAYYYDNIKSLRVSPVAPSTNPANPWQVALVADYFLSKRTDVYIASAFAKNAALDLDSVATGYAYGYSLAQGATNQLGVAIGIRHKF